MDDVHREPFDVVMNDNMLGVVPESFVERERGFVDVRARTVEQLGIPSEVLSARKP